MGNDPAGAQVDDASKNNNISNDKSRKTNAGGPLCRWFHCGLHHVLEEMTSDVTEIIEDGRCW